MIPQRQPQIFLASPPSPISSSHPVSVRTPSLLEGTRSIKSLIADYLTSGGESVQLLFFSMAKQAEGNRIWLANMSTRIGKDLQEVFSGLHQNFERNATKHFG